MSFKALLLGTAIAAVSAAPSFAQNGPDDDIITVNGSRLNQAATEVGSSVTIITSEDIDRLGIDFAVDAVASAPGVTVNQNGGFGGQSSVRIRGAGSEQTLVLIDGVAVTDPSSPGGGYDFARLDTESIERIEVLKGPQSTLWGGDAIGGVVSIITRKPDSGFGATAFGELGAFNTARLGASIQGAGDIGDARLALTTVNSEGYSKADAANGNTEKDGYESITVSGSGGINAGLARIEASLLYTSADTDFDSFVFGAQGSVGDGDESAETEEVSGNVSVRLPLLDGRFENLFLAGYADIDRQNFAGSTPSFGAEGDRKLLRYQGTFHVNERNKLAFGAEREESTADGNETSIDGLFALYEVKPVDGLTLTGGLRLDDHETFGSETTARVAAAYNPTENITVRGTWGQGFKAPSIFQTTFFCCGAAAPNANLQPETSDAFDVGIDYRTTDGRGEIGVSYFDQSVENLISFAFAIGGYENIPGAETSGVEVFGNYQVLDWLNVAANYTYIEAEDNTGQRLVRVPKHSGDITLSVTPEGPFSGAVLVRYNGEERDSGGLVDDWVRVDLNAAFDVNDNVEFYGRIENVFDKQYQQVLGYGTPGASASVGVRLRY